MEKLDKISVSKASGAVEVSNPTQFKMIGKGHQGAVFQIDDHRCVKIYNTKIDRDRELDALQRGNQIGITPKVYITGDKFIVMEFIKHPSLFEYLDNNPLDKELTGKIVDLLDSFEQIGFNRFDHSARHIYVVPNGKLKIIDVVHMIKSEPVMLAKKLLGDLGDKAEDFIHLVKEVSPKWYDTWKNHPDYDGLMFKIKNKGK